jgi:serine/threonine protein phosphatase 1
MARYAISDIHGCYHTFKELLNSIRLNKTDELILLGDYINRGKYSKEVVDFIMQLQSEKYNIHCLKGNHEEMVFDSFLYDEWPGGAENTLQSFGISHLKELPRKYINWLLKLKNYHLSGRDILVHAGLDFSREYILQENQNMYWITDWYKNIDYKRLGNKKIIHGHKSLGKQSIIKMRDNIEHDQVLDIDNGCWKKDEPGMGSLCCIDLDNKELFFEVNID